MTLRRVSIIGMGLIGTSMALRLRGEGLDVTGYDVDVGHMRVAEDRGALDRSSPGLDAAVAECDVAILAVPVPAILALLPRVDAAAPEHAVIADTGSVKGPVVESMTKLAGASRAVGAHPIAGRETSGPAAADASLFEGRPFAVCPSSATRSDCRRQILEFAAVLGARAVVVDADEHDRALAYTSHLPQLLASALAASTPEAFAEFVGPGYRDMTRLSESDPGLWADIFLLNGDRVVEAASALHGSLDIIVGALQQHDRPGLKSALADARDRRSGLQARMPA